MTDTTNTAARGAFDSIQIGHTMRRFGGVAFWVQILIALVPIIVITAVFSSVYGVQSPTRNAGIMGLLSLIGFVILIFTTFWCWRYVKLGRGFVNGDKADAKRLASTVWFGLVVTTTGIAISMIVLLTEMSYLLIRFLEAPQGGVPVIQTVEGGTSWISAVDILGLMTVVLTLAAEIVVLVAGLWILARVENLRQRTAS